MAYRGGLLGAALCYMSPNFRYYEHNGVTKFSGWSVVTLVVVATGTMLAAVVYLVLVGDSVLRARDS